MCDIGETLLADPAEWAAWADWLEIPRHALSVVIGAVTAAARDHAEAFERPRPGLRRTAQPPQLISPRAGR